MARYIAPESQDNGPAYLKANCNQIAAVLAYAVGDSYATVMAAGNVVASSPMASPDFTFADGAANTRVLNNATKTVTASGSGNPTHYVFVDTISSKILRVTEETSAPVVSVGVQVTFPNLPFESRQPVAV